MKIGFDAKRAVQNFTGLGNYSRFVINNLAKYYPNNSYKLFTEREPNVNSEITNSEAISYIIKKDKRPFWRTFGIVEDIKKTNIDLYHGLSNELPYNIDKVGIKSVVTIHDLIFLKYPHFYPFIDRKIYNIKAKYACEKADRIVAISECTKKDIIEYYKIDPSKIDVVYQGCFPIFDKQASDEDKNKLKNKLNINFRYLLSVGSIEERKNILLIVKALKYIPDIHFVAVGKQRKYAEIVMKYAAENGLSDRVHFLSNIPLAELPIIIQSADVFIYPSRYEGFGIPIIEAIKSRVPVIAATGSCLEEAGGPYSIYVDPDDEKQLADSVTKVLNNTELRCEMINKSLEYINRFSYEKCTEDMVNVYKSILK